MQESTLVSLSLPLSETLDFLLSEHFPGLSSRAEPNRDRGESRDSAPPTPPCVRVRTRRFGGLCTPRAQTREAERLKIGIRKSELQGLGGAGAPGAGGTATEGRRVLADAPLAQLLVTPARCCH